MIVNLYTIKDTCAGYAGKVLTYPNDNLAIRDFIQICNGVQFAPSDLQLYKIGQFDSVTLKITPCEPEFIKAGDKNEQ